MPAQMRQPTQATTLQPTQQRGRAAANAARNAPLTPVVPPPNPYGTPTGRLGNQELYYEGAPNPPGGIPPPATNTPPPPNNEMWGSTDEAYLRSQVDRIFAQYGRTAREDEYAQWAGPNGYMAKADVDGTGRSFQGWDPYWAKRLDQHARGDYYGDGFADEDGAAQTAARNAAGLNGGGSGTDLASLVQSLGNSGGSGGSGGGGGTPPGPGWVKTAAGGWVPPDHPLAQGPLASTTPGNTNGQTGSGSSSTTPFMGDDIRAKVMELLNSEGALNQRVMDSRTESLREDQERARQVGTQSLDATLAERGLTGDGADITGRVNLEEELGRTHGTQLRDLYSEEAQRADDRMMQALVTGAGMTISEAQQAIDRFNAETGRFNADTQRTGVEGNLANERARLALDELLGKGGLGLGQAQLAASYGLGQGRLDLDRTLGMGSLQQGQTQSLLDILRILSGQNTNT